MFWFEDGHVPAVSAEIVLYLKNRKNMSALFVLVIVSIIVAGSFLGAFIWSVKTDQYEDKDGAAMRMLYENDVKNTTL